MNRVDLIGRPTRDSKISRAQNGNPICIAAFTLAVPRRGKKKEGGEADFLYVKAFGAVAENVGKYVRKGRLIGVSGHLQSDSYPDKETGKLMFMTTVVAENVDFLWEKGSVKEGPDDLPPLPTDDQGYILVPEEGDDDLPFR